MDSCKLNTGQLHFGDYSAIHPAPKRSHTSIQVRCSGRGSYSLALSRGHGDFNRRKMTSTSDHLYYNIFANASLSQVWGDGTGNTAVLSGSYRSGHERYSRQNHTVFGVIYPKQDSYPGVYTDDLYISFIF